jgi:hypothetical protein
LQPSSLQDLGQLNRYLRDAFSGVEWLALVANAIQEAVADFEVSEEQPVIELRSAVRRTDPWLIEGFAHSVEPTMIFADGGAYKSFTAMAIGLALNTGESQMGFEPCGKRRVLYLDWELNAEEHRSRAARLLGTQELPDLLYRKCTRPIDQEAPVIREAIERFGVDFLIIDSAAPACGRSPESSEAPAMFFQVLRRDLRLPALVLAHVTKKGDVRYPFGSVFWHNFARTTWSVDRETDEGGNAVLTLHNRKNNLGKLHDPIALSLSFERDRIIGTRVAAPIVDLGQSSGNVQDRIIAELEEHPQSVTQLVASIGVKRDTIQRRLRDMEKDKLVDRAPGANGEVKLRAALPDPDHRTDGRASGRVRPSV